jgi:hypothetical protein
MRSRRARFAIRIAGYLLGLFIVFRACPVLEAWAQEATETADGEPKPPPPEEKPSTIKALAGYGLSIAGAFVVIALVIHTLSKTLKYEQARNAIIHLLRSNPNQAEMQCRTMPHSFYDAIGAALKTGAMAASTQDLATIQTATIPTFDAIAGQVIQHWKGLVGKTKLAIVASVGAIALKPGILTIVLGVAAGAGILWLMYYKSEIERSLFRAKVEILPEVDNALVQGRYYVPPPP